MLFFFFKYTATPEISPLSLHDPLPIVSHDLVPLEDCPITVEPAARAVLDRRWPGAGAVDVAVDSAGTVTTTRLDRAGRPDRKSTRLNSSHANISYAVFCLKKKKKY